MIELLVVIAIIAILAALLLPALAAAKQRAIIIEGMNNQHQIEIALNSYAIDHHSKLPVMQKETVNGVNVNLNWAWDVPEDVGNSMVKSGLEWKSFYDPGTAQRFTMQDDWALWNSSNIVGQVPNTLHVVGYAFAFAGPNSCLSLPNQNKSLLQEEFPKYSFTYPGAPMVRIPPSERVVVACATICSSPSVTLANRFQANWTHIKGGYIKEHTSPHLDGQIPSGGNVGFMDGHVKWRKFVDMQPRADKGIGFWW